MERKMNKKIEKPITVIRQEFIDTLSDVINNSKLPLFIVEPILRDMYLEVKSLSQQQYEFEKAEYESRLRVGDVNETK
jgi:hypothetical protein